MQCYINWAQFNKIFTKIISIDEGVYCGKYKNTWEPMSGVPVHIFWSRVWPSIVKIGKYIWEIKICTNGIKLCSPNMLIKVCLFAII